MAERALILAPYFFRDLAEGIQQQMYFWGQDVLHPEGNLLVEQGFERGQSKGLKGTSCYRLEWQGGHIELYGSCAGWYGGGSGFVFLRPQRRCVVWSSSVETPVPGSWQTELIHKPTNREELYTASQPLLDWLISHEEAVNKRFGDGYRMENYRSYQKVPKAKAWIEPDAALSWFRCFRENPSQLKRPKFFTNEYCV
ncbi:hypothetical protein [Rubritalea sp.]|uniref:hypothetical protein n=1 Tax=Rubritalea sp. TaxID=2109375 RepID=UPI003EF516AB